MRKEDSSWLKLWGILQYCNTLMIRKEDVWFRKCWYVICDCFKLPRLSQLILQFRKTKVLVGWTKGRYIHKQNAVQRNSKVKCCLMKSRAVVKKVLKNHASHVHVCKGIYICEQERKRGNESVKTTGFVVKCSATYTGDLHGILS